MASAVEPTPAPSPPTYTTHKVPYPATLQKGRYVWPYVGAFLVYHLLALLVVVPWLFSWAGLALA